jgi:hypothetical protein
MCSVLFLLPIEMCYPQVPVPSETSLQERIRTLTESMNRVEAQIQNSQREMDEIRHQLDALRESAGVAPDPVPGSSSAEPSGSKELAEAVASLREAQGIEDTQIATLEQTKVESASKYPVKLSGIILFTGFVNTRQVDTASEPTIALAGAGSTGATLRQTILGLDAAGPHLFGAGSHADLRFDLNASASAPGYGGGYSFGTLRMRTAHAELNWDRTRAFFALDRPIINPETPTSLTAVAEPPLAWSGNLWAWNPQIGVSHDLLPARSGNLRIQGSLIDVADPPSPYGIPQGATYTPPSTAESSRWPGMETRIAYVNTRSDDGAQFGLGAFFAPHRTAGSMTFNSWATTVDFLLPASRFMQLSGSAYRGQALGGLGEGASKDYVTQTIGAETYFRALGDSGGWMQWKQRTAERLEFNEAFGIDNVPAQQLRPYALSTPVNYYNLARNRTFTGNVIYSPSAYLSFTLEYRRIASSYVTSRTLFSDVIGIGAGYKF